VRLIAYLPKINFRLNPLLKKSGSVVAERVLKINTEMTLINRGWQRFRTKSGSFFLRWFICAFWSCSSEKIQSLPFRELFQSRSDPLYCQIPPKSTSQDTKATQATLPLPCRGSLWGGLSFFARPLILGGLLGLWRFGRLPLPFFSVILCFV